MHTNDTTTTTELLQSIDFRDAESWASGFVNACTNMDALDLLPPAARELYHGVGPMFEVASGDVSASLAYILCLDALASSPTALVAIARELRQTLIDADPRLQVPYGGDHV